MKCSCGGEPVLDRTQGNIAKFYLRISCKKCGAATEWYSNLVLDQGTQVTNAWRALQKERNDSANQG